MTSKVIIIDDEPLAIDVIENYLQRMDNIETRRCENAIEAFRLLKEEEFFWKKWLELALKYQGCFS